MVLSYTPYTHSWHAGQPEGNITFAFYLFLSVPSDHTKHEVWHQAQVPGLFITEFAGRMDGLNPWTPGLCYLFVRQLVGARK
jgi:hypothetical protein